MHDFGCWDPDDMNFDLMKQTAKFYKEDPKGGEIVCVAFEQTRNEKAIRIAMNLIEKGKLSTVIQVFNDMSTIKPEWAM